MYALLKNMLAAAADFVLFFILWLWLGIPWMIAFFLSTLIVIGIWWVLAWFFGWSDHWLRG